MKERESFRRISDQDAGVYVRQVSSQLGVGGPLISSPATSHFLPAIRVPELQDAILLRVLGKLKTLAAIALFFSLLCALFVAIRPAGDVSVLARTAVLLALIGAFWFYSYRVAARDRATWQEWSIFLDWQKRFAGSNLYVPLAVIILFGLLQLGFALAGHDRDELFHRFGVVFASIDRGEYWRFLIGPLLHASVSHWVMNFLLLLLVLPYLTPARHRLGVLLLGYGAIVVSGVAVYAQHQAGMGAAQAVDSFAGASALIYFACGFALANTLAHKDWYPCRYASWLAVSTIILLASSHTVNGNISFAAHATGLLFGLASGWPFKPEARTP